MGAQSKSLSVSHLWHRDQKERALLRRSQKVAWPDLGRYNSWLEFLCWILTLVDPNQFKILSKGLPMILFQAVFILFGLINLCCASYTLYEHCNVSKKNHIKPGRKMSAVILIVVIVADIRKHKEFEAFLYVQH